MNNRTMSITPTGNNRTRHSLLYRLANELSSSEKERVENLAAVRRTHELLRKAFPGETVRLYNPAQDLFEAQQRLEVRNLRIAALAATPSSLTPAAIAQLEGITPHRVRQILRATAKNGNAGG